MRPIVYHCFGYKLKIKGSTQSEFHQIRVLVFNKIVSATSGSDGTRDYARSCLQARLNDCLSFEVFTNGPKTDGKVTLEWDGKAFYEADVEFTNQQPKIFRSLHGGILDGANSQACSSMICFSFSVCIPF